jgi:hypothetical protein
MLLGSIFADGHHFGGDYFDMPAIEVWIHILAANWEIFYEGLI